jgi:hypothetical protein
MRMEEENWRSAATNIMYEDYRKKFRRPGGLILHKKMQVNLLQRIAHLELYFIKPLKPKRI